MRYLAVLLAALMAGCAGSPAAGLGTRISTFVKGEGAPALEAGVQQFENGQYADAARSLQRALDLGLNTASERARTHKYLAFIHCVSSRLTQCRDQFGRALEASPDMELEASEAGHPIWGPAFRTVKAGR
jgi:Tfp pilus assembly protein PilF